MRCGHGQATQVVITLRRTDPAADHDVTVPAWADALIDLASIAGSHTWTRTTSRCRDVHHR
jgi:hypothetical protein